MTSTSTVTSPAAPATAPVARIAWRRLTWVSWRQHRTGLAWVLGAFALAAAIMAASGLAERAAAPWPASNIWNRSNYLGYYAFFGLSPLIMQLFPLLGGLFLGAPLLAREAESGTIALAWTQGADRSRWLLAKVVPITVLLGLAAFGLATELNWWIIWRPIDAWSPMWFDLNPLPFAGWTVLAFALGVLLGGVIRRTVAAIGALTGGYLALMFAASAFWRDRYLPPLHRLDPPNTDLGGSSGIYAYSGARVLPPPGPRFLSTDLVWPDGRACYCWDRYGSWLTQHHIKMLTVYQPGSRYAVFGAIEFGWLTLLAILLLTATAIMIRRRST